MVFIFHFDCQNISNCSAPGKVSNAEIEWTGSRLRQHPDSCMWCGVFFSWQKFASGQEGHWSCLKEASEPACWQIVVNRYDSAIDQV